VRRIAGAGRLPRTGDNAARRLPAGKTRMLPWDKVKSSQARDDHLAMLIYDARLSGAQRQTLRQLIKLQKAALRLRVMALPQAHKAGYLVRADADGRRRTNAGGLPDRGRFSIG
jgi:hypothetical protein